MADWLRSKNQNKLGEVDETIGYGAVAITGYVRFCCDKDLSFPFVSGGMLSGSAYQDIEIKRKSLTRDKGVIYETLKFDPVNGNLSLILRGTKLIKALSDWNLDRG